MRSQRLSRSVTAKMTEQEYTSVSELAEVSNQNLSEYVRQCLIQQIRRPVIEILLAEILALRAIVVNLLFRAHAGQPLTQNDMRDVLEHADSGKLHKARLLMQELVARTKGENNEQY